MDFSRIEMNIYEKTTGGEEHAYEQIKTADRNMKKVPELKTETAHGNIKKDTVFILSVKKWLQLVLLPLLIVSFLSVSLFLIVAYFSLYETEETLRYSVAQQNMDLKNLTKNVNTTITKMQQQIVSNSARVALTACADVTGTVNGVVKFNDIKTNRNIHNLSYFKKNGNFTIGFEGLYLVSTWIFSNTNGATYALYRNGNTIAIAYAHYDNDYINSNGGTTTAIVSLELKAGDAIWVQTTTSMYVYARYSCFTIVKLK